MKLLDRLVVGTLPVVPKYIVRQFSKPYVAGENLEDALEAVRLLNEKAALATLALLGESVDDREAAIVARDTYVNMLGRIAHWKLDANVSLKPTQLGLKVDQTFCFENIRHVVATASQHNNFVRIDMEDASCTDATLEIYRALRKEYKNLGTVLQAYLKRSLDDARVLARLGANVRICKGIYVEPSAIAYKDPQVIRDSFLELVRALAGSGSYVAVASHDEVLVERATALLSELGLGRNEYEYQMLYGVRPGLGKSLVSRGERLRIYVPYGRDWYAYCVRRLRENPTLAGYVFKNLFTG